MSRPDLVVRGERVVLPDGVAPASIHVRAGRIVSIKRPVDVPERVPVVEAGDRYVLPGLVDTHVHLNEPGRTEWEGFRAGTRAAAVGGTTTVVDMPLNSDPPTLTVEALAAKRAAANRSAHVDVGMWGGIVPENLDAIVHLADAGVVGFKCFLVDPGVPGFAPVDLPTLAAALERLSGRGIPVAVHAEDPAVLAQAPEPGGDLASWEASRPVEAEVQAVAEVCRIARQVDTPVHIVHVSAPEALAPVLLAQADGARVTAETCPHYLAFALEELPPDGVLFKCAPPIRGAAARDGLWKALARGALEIVVSDHSPAPPELKLRDMATAWGGISGLQVRLPVVWTEAVRRGFDIGSVVRWLATAPARFAGLPHKGVIAPAADADLVVFDPDVEWTVTEDRLHHRHRLSPYIGRRVRGSVDLVLLRGRRVAEDGEPVGGHRGEVLERRAGWPR